MKRLRTLVHKGHDADSPLLVNNYRPVQPLNGRTLGFYRANVVNKLTKQNELAVIF